MINLTRRLQRRGLLSPAKSLEWYPPLRAMRIRVLELSRDWRRMRILLPLSRRTRNPGGSMFGGSMAALADPIAALACSHVFPGYAVWTRALEIDFRREARTDLEVRFVLEPELERHVARELAERDRATPCFEYAFYTAEGTPCALVHNRVAIRRAGYSRLDGATGATPRRDDEQNSLEH